jgi:LPS sulfotransferase NodH
MDALCAYPGDPRATGYKLMYGHLRRYPELMLAFKSKKFKMIHLLRENHLDKIISAQVAEQTGIAHSESALNVRSVVLDPQVLLKQLVWSDKQVRYSRMFLKVMGVPHLDVSYQDLVDRHAETVREIVGFLGADTSFLCHSKLEKSIKNTHEQLIENYAEVQAVLSGTRFEGLIN